MNAQILKMKPEIKISVLVAVYNVGEYLEECLNSLLVQTEMSAEFLVIDDGSTDRSSEICDQFAKRDNRFHVIHFGRNQGTLLARKVAIHEASGKYSIFVDGDDFLLRKDALRLLVQGMEASDADIGGFGCSVFAENEVWGKGLEDYLSFPEGKEIITSVAILDEMFSCDAKMAFTLWTKCYKTQNLKKIEKYIPDVHCVMAEDVFMEFLIASNSEKFSTITKSKIYGYRVGFGVSTSKITKLNIDTTVSQLNVIGYLNDYLHASGLFDKYSYLLESIKNMLHANCVKTFVQVEEETIRNQAFHTLFCKTDKLFLLYKMIWFAKNDIEREKLSKAIKYYISSYVMEPENGNVGLVFRENGRAVEEIRRLIQNLKKQSIKVHLLLEEEMRGVLGDSLENESVIWIPRYGIVKRECIIKESIKTNKLRVVVFFSEIDELLLYDVFSAREESAEVMIYDKVKNANTWCCLDGKTPFEEKNIFSYICRIASFVNIQMDSEKHGNGSLFRLSECLSESQYQCELNAWIQKTPLPANGNFPKDPPRAPEKVKLYKRIAHGLRDGLRAVRSWGRG